MKTYITITLDTRKERKDGTYPILFRISHKRKTIPIASGYSVKETDWNETNKVVKSTFKGIDTPSRLNNLLLKKKSEMLTKITQLYESGVLETLDISELKHHLLQSDTSGMFLDYTNTQIELLKKSGRFGSARSYYSMYLMVKKFRKDKDIPFEEITGSFLRKLEADYLSRGNSLNGLAALLRSLRAVYNKAVSDKIITGTHYPFKDYHIRKTPTVKRAISQEAIQSIISLKLDQKDKCFNARNYFLFSYLTFGMNFTDMAWLKVENISEGRIKYVRQKTKKVYDVKILDSVKPILDFYCAGKKPGDFIFPIIRNEDPAQQHKNILWARKRYNIKLNIIAGQCGITENLTSYVSRHSAATAALFVGIPVTAISQLLGHSSLAVTQTYLKTLPDSVIDSYHEQVVKALG